MTDTVRGPRVLVPSRGWRAAAGLAAVCVSALAIYSALSTAPPSADYDTFGGNLREVAFLVYLVAAAAAMGSIDRRRVGVRRSAALIAVGYTIVAVGVAAGLVAREDPDWFPVLGVPGNLLAIVGWVMFGVLAVRTRILATWAGVLAAVGGVFAVLFADFGSGVLIGAFWLYLALDRRTA